MPFKMSVQFCAFCQDKGPELFVCAGYNGKECAGALCTKCAPQLATVTSQERADLTFLCHQCERVKYQQVPKQYQVSRTVWFDKM